MNVQVKLPARIMPARHLRVVNVNTIEVMLDVGYGTHVEQTFVVEGMHRPTGSEELRERMKRAMIVMLGGKRLYVQTADFSQDRSAPKIGRVFLAEPVFGDPPGLRVPYGMDAKCLEVGEFFQYLSRYGYDHDVLLKHINKPKKKEEPCPPRIATTAASAPTI